MPKKLIFGQTTNYGQTYMKFALTMATTKMMDTQLTYQNFR